MTRINHILRELGRNLKRHPGTVFGSLLSLTMLLLLFDLFWVAGRTSELFYDNLLAELRVEVFLPEEYPDSGVSDLQNSMLSLPEVYSAEFVSKDMARMELERLVGIDLLIGYDSTNPLPRSMLIEVEPEYASVDDLDRLSEQLRQMCGGGEVHYSRDWLERTESTRSLMLRAGFLLGGLIMLTTILNSANNIRLMARARALGLRQMMLLGAGRIMTSLPFLIEGFLIAVVSAALGWAAILYGKERISFSQFELVYPGDDQIILFCLVMGVIGMVSGYVGIRRLLK